VRRPYRELLPDAEHGEGTNLSLYRHRLQSLAEARRIVGEFITRYNTEWLIERLGHQTPVAARTAPMAA
jgi:transposase InsO family protein